MNRAFSPGHHARADAREGGGEAVEGKMKRLAVSLREKQAEAARLAVETAGNLKELGCGG